MARRPSKHPTELELAILKVLWKQSPLSVREVREILRPTRKLAHTSVMTMLSIMVGKGYLRREKQGNSYVYEPTEPRKATRRKMLRDLVDRVFDGSAASVMTNLIETGELDEDEVRELRKLLKRIEKEASR